MPRRWTAEFLIRKGWCRMAENKSTDVEAKSTGRDTSQGWRRSGGFEYSVGAGCADWLGPASGLTDLFP